MNGKGGKHNPGKENSERKKTDKDFKGHNMFREQ